MFEAELEATPRVNEVEIPLIQRDYAQGREDLRTSAIRTRFLDALHAALIKDEPVGLDFIYGEVRNGTFEPLAGDEKRQLSGRRGRAARFRKPRLALLSAVGGW